MPAATAPVTSSVSSASLSTSVPMSVETWVTTYQPRGVRPTEQHPRDAVLQSLDELVSLEDELHKTSVDDLKHIVRILEIPDASSIKTFGRANTEARAKLVKRIVQMARWWREALEGDEEVEEPSSAEGEAGGGPDDPGSPEVKAHDRPHSDAPPKPSVPSVPRHQPARSRAKVPHAAGAWQMDDDELQEVVRLANLAHGSVSPGRLSGLSEPAERLYHELRKQQRAAPPSSPSPLELSSVRRSLQLQTAPTQSPARLPAMGSLSTRARPTPLPRRSPAPVVHASPRCAGVTWGENAEDEAADSELLERQIQPKYIPHSPLSATLLRQGVPDALVGEDMLDHVRRHVNGVPFEQWWTARQRQMQGPHTHAYFEGLTLSLILDNIDDPSIVAEIAARRWYSVYLNALENMDWDQARAWLPLQSHGGMSALQLYEVQKFAKAQQQLRTASSASRGTSSRNKKGGKYKGGGPRDDAAEQEGTGGSSKGSNKPRRNNGSGAGVAQPGASGATVK